MDFTPFILGSWLIAPVNFADTQLDTGYNFTVIVYSNVIFTGRLKCSNLAESFTVIANLDDISEFRKNKTFHAFLCLLRN